MITFLAAEAGRNRDEVATVTAACGATLAFVSGDFEGAFARLLDDISGAPAWLKTGVRCALSGDTQLIMANAESVATGLLNNVVNDPVAQKQVAALVQLVMGVIKCLHDTRELAGNPATRKKMFLQVGAAVKDILPEELADMAELVQAVLSLYAGDLSGLKPIAMKLGKFDEDKITKVVAAVQAVMAQLQKLKRQATAAAAKGKQALENASGIPTSNKSIKEMFATYDVDGSGSLDFREFRQLCRYLGLSLSEYRAKEMFSLADKNGSHVLDEEEFEVALGLLREEVSAR